jgi:signal transduction histidine kinase
MDKRLNHISSILSDYSRGSFDKQLLLSSKLDTLDGISGSINMLGEELKAATISRNYFNNIFNAVTDIILVINTAGVIEQANLSAETQLGSVVPLIGQPLGALRLKGLPHFRKLLTGLKQTKAAQYDHCSLKTGTGAIVQLRVNLVYFCDEQSRFRVLLTATDISFRVKTENMVIRAMIESQEKERTRLAKDFHDSIIQQMAGIKFQVSTTAGNLKDAAQKKVLMKANIALGEMITEIRNICFNLMPRSLEEFGLVKTVQVFCSHSFFAGKLKFDIREPGRFPVLPVALSTDLYRVIQEFVYNAVKHGMAKRVIIAFAANRNSLSLVLQDNGKGFNLQQPRSGMGLKNVQSRIRSHEGKLELASTPGKGTFFKINIPLN